MRCCARLDTAMWSDRARAEPTHIRGPYQLELSLSRYSRPDFRHDDELEFWSVCLEDLVCDLEHAGGTEATPATLARFDVIYTYRLVFGEFEHVDPN